RQASHQVNQTACRSLAFWRARRGARTGRSRGTLMIRQIVASATLFTALFAALFAVAASGPVLAQQQQHTGNAQLAAVISAFEQLERRIDPLTAGGEGDRAALRRLPDVSPQAIAAAKGDLINLRSQLAQVPDHGLNDADTINRAFLMRVISEGIEAID